MTLFTKCLHVCHLNCLNQIGAIVNSLNDLLKCGYILGYDGYLIPIFHDQFSYPKHQFYC